MQPEQLAQDLSSGSYPSSPAEITSFKHLHLSPIALRALKRLGYETPSPIQAKVIPPALDGRDILGQARSPLVATFAA